MVNEREKRRLDLEGLTEEEFKAEYENVFGEGVTPSHKAQAVESILDKEFKTGYRATHRGFCRRCGKNQSILTTGSQHQADGTFTYIFECVSCHTWHKVYGGTLEELLENVTTPDCTNYEIIDDPRVDDLATSNRLVVQTDSVVKKKWYVVRDPLVTRRGEGENSPNYQNPVDLRVAGPFDTEEEALAEIQQIGKRSPEHLHLLHTWFAG